jgi:predicted metal-dependent hydrolase
MSQKKFKYGKYEYNYFLQKLDRKTLSMTVYPSLHILVKCPIDCSEERLNDFLKRKWLWLDRQLKFFKQFKEERSPKEYISGESFLYLGRQYKLEVKQGKENKVTFSKGRIHLTTLCDPRDGLINKEILKKWYKDRAKEVFIERYEQILKNFRFEHKPEIILREMPKRWGSFVANKKIILNPQLIKSSKDCIDYVITHELCHVTHKRHSTQFYRKLTHKYPHWEKIKDKLELRFIGEH